MNCIFCKIINNEIPSYTIYEDKLVKAILDINPDSSGHTLILTKKHFNNIEDIDTSTLNHVMEISKKLYMIISSKLNADGITLIQNNGLPQDIKHFHLHLKPSYIKNEVLILEEVYNKLKNNV